MTGRVVKLRKMRGYRCSPSICFCASGASSASLSAVRGPAETNRRSSNGGDHDRAGGRDGDVLAGADDLDGGTQDIAGGRDGDVHACAGVLDGGNRDSAGDRDGSYRDNAGDNQGDDHNGASGVQCENPAVAGVSVGGDHDNAVSIFTANMVTLPYSPTLSSPPGIKIARDISQ